jgi:outer membrane protein TolC
VDQAALQSEMARQFLRYHTLRAYYGVLVAKARKDVADESVRLAESDVASIRDRFETGLLVQSDLLATEVQLADFRQQQIDANGNLIIARKTLSSVIGLPLTTEYEITGELTPTTFSIAPRETLLSDGLEARPDVQIASLATDQAELGKRIAGGQYLPRVDAFASWGASGNSISDQNDDYAIGAVVRLDLLQPGRLSRLSEARAQELAAEASQARVRNEAELDVESAYHRFLAAGQRLAVGEKSVEQSDETLRIVRDRYDQGLTTITEVLRAQTAAVQAKLARLGSLYDYYVGYASVLRATGALTTIEPFVVSDEPAPSSQSSRRSERNERAEGRITADLPHSMINCIRSARLLDSASSRRATGGTVPSCTE